MADQIGPRCGNNPNVRLTEGDRKVVDEFRAFLDARAALRDRIAEALSEVRRPGLGGLTEAEAVRRMADAVLKVLPSCSDPIECSHEAALGEAREKHRASLRRADEINNELMEEVQRYAAGTERPVLWSVYNQMHLRAVNAESAVGRVRAVLETEAVVGRSALEYRGLITSALMAAEAQQDGATQ
ncbi:hypothetical protein [Streptomyces griseorubiginosus]|uniref:hypothetical protein n=1 Tax=Streptomyces griseorubiginosus TaxID=67304 RepID=UPI0036EE2DF2